MDKPAVLQQWVEDSHSIVFFGGAGVSTESGIPDFRSTDGLYSQSYAYPPETILSRSFFQRNPAEFFRFYRDKMLAPDAQPNAAHRKLAELEQAGRLSAVITQNIDGLHQRPAAGRYTNCTDPSTATPAAAVDGASPLDEILHTTGIPTCPCGGIIKPDVVLYEEPLDESTVARAVPGDRAGRSAHRGRDLAVGLSCRRPAPLLSRRTLGSHQPRPHPVR